MFVPAIISITFALFFYTIGVWWEHKKDLKACTCDLFYIGSGL